MKSRNEILPEMPDTILIERIMGGEKELFEVIMRRYNQRLYRVGMSVLNNDSVIEDLMQSTYIKAYQNLAKFKNRSSFSTWLTRIMINECLMMKRKTNRLSLLAESGFENLKAMRSTSQPMLNKEVAGVLESAISNLPDIYRHVFVLREIEELSVKETGEVLHIGEPNVKVRLNRAKSMLRDRLKEYMTDGVYSFHLSRCDRVVRSVMQQLAISCTL